MAIAYALPQRIVNGSRFKTTKQQRRTPYLAQHCACTAANANQLETVSQKPQCQRWLDHGTLSLSKALRANNCQPRLSLDQISPFASLGRLLSLAFGHLAISIQAQGPSQSWQSPSPRSTQSDSPPRAFTRCFATTGAIDADNNKGEGGLWQLSQAKGLKALALVGSF